MITSRRILPRVTIFSSHESCKENQNTPSCSVNPPPPLPSENRRARRATDFNMAHARACWVTRATNTRSECVEIVAFEWQYWLRERTWLSLCTCIGLSCLGLLYTTIFTPCLALVERSPCLLCVWTEVASDSSLNSPGIQLKKFHFFFLWRCAPTGAMASSFLRFLDHTQRRITVGRTPLDEWSVRHRDLYLTTHKTHSRQTSMPPVGFEPTISAGERP